MSGGHAPASSVLTARIAGEECGQADQTHEGDGLGLLGGSPRCTGHTSLRPWLFSCHAASLPPTLPPTVSGPGESGTFGPVSRSSIGG